MKYLRSIYGLIFLCFLPTSKGGCESINVGVIEFPPHVVFQGDIQESTAIIYINDVLSKIYSEINIIKLPNKRALMELQKGRIDLLLPVAGFESEFSTLSKALFHSTPGICFKKQNFIPFLSAKNMLEGLIIGVPTGISIVPSLLNAKTRLYYIEGSDVLRRGIEQLRMGRINGFYHPSPINVYHYNNPLAKEIACSYFYGYSEKIHILVSPNLSLDEVSNIDNAYTLAMKEISYEFFYADKMATMHVLKP